MVARKAQSEVRDFFVKWPILCEASHGDLSALQIVRDDIIMLDIALQCGVDPDLRDSTGTTLLMDYSGIGDLDRVELLLGRGADVNTKNFAGESPLSIAVARGNVEVARKLKKAGADTGILVGGVELSVWADLSGSEKMRSWIREDYH